MTLAVQADYGRTERPFELSLAAQASLEGVASVTLLRVYISRRLFERSRGYMGGLGRAVIRVRALDGRTADVRVWHGAGWKMADRQNTKLKEIGL